MFKINLTFIKVICRNNGFMEGRRELLHMQHIQLASVLYIYTNKI